ncbi:RNA polymerase sigma-70 factor (ECF subfamily) [Sphingomonas aerophila]|uniref:RNA polymerase sigma-70 factor (ECF subfamily) n=2 Tax=Sphingomonas aerophila TaxID=1344948 RepID=A0A7W9BHJ1_9SPHN|nr:RNA polymerase sigma-70 factor (ECF subfamily) [Sphingomonas aerophila]
MRGGGIRNGEPFAGLIRDHAGIVRKVAAAYARDPHDRADLMQDILANLWAAWPRYDAARPFPTWMYRVALNVALSRVRSVYRERRVMTPLTSDHDAVAATDPDHEANQALEALHATLARFDPLNRAVLLLYLDERSHREIGEIVGIGESAVGTRIDRIKQKLRRELA